MPSFDTQDTTQHSLQSQMDEKGYVSGTVTRTLTVVSSAPTTVVEIRLYAAIPRENDYHPETLSLYATSVKIEPRNGSLIFFDVEVTYSSRPRPSTTGDDIPPYELPVEISWKSMTTDEPCDEDINGNPIEVPGTHKPIEGVTRPITDLVGVFKKNYAGFAPQAIYLYNNKVNSDTFLGFSAGLAMVKSINAELRTGSDIVYWEIVVEIHFRIPYNTTAAKAWWPRVLCQGFDEVDTSGNIVRSMDDEKNPVTTPVLLSAVDGTRLAPADPAEWLEFETVDSIAFSGMGLF